MEKLTKCTGEGCLLKYECHRFTEIDYHKEEDAGWCAVADLKAEMKTIKASQKQKGRIIKKLKANNDELLIEMETIKKTLSKIMNVPSSMEGTEFELYLNKIVFPTAFEDDDELYDETNPDHSHKCENEKCLNNAPDTHHECHRCAGYLE